MKLYQFNSHLNTFFILSKNVPTKEQIKNKMLELNLHYDLITMTEKTTNLHKELRF